MASTISGSSMSHLFPSVGPALMISMEYIDLGKWVAAVEGGARFGFDLVFLVLLFNCIAILCQYLSTCIGTATGKSLAEICGEEYCKVPCILLGVQAEVSLIISDLSTILGIAHGLNLLFGMDISTCIFYAAVGLVLLPALVNLLDHSRAEALYIGIAGFALLFYVFGVLISQPEVPLTMSGIFPKLSGDSAYAVMALLGANVMVHNFYIQSSIVKQQQKQPIVATDSLFHDHFFATLFIFTGIFLVNYVLMNSAAAVFASADVVFNFQDISVLMDQIFRSPIAPVALYLVLLFSSQITGLSRNIGGRLIFKYFFCINSSWVHQTSVKALTIVPALYCAKSAGTEGIYQLLILCQIVLATLLPSSVIPLFRVASSRFNMGSFKIAWHLEILALFAFLVMFASNLSFVMEMLFGNSSWMINLIGGMENTVTIPYIVLLCIACASIGLTLYLAVTPLKSASDKPETETWTSDVVQDQAELPEVGEDNDFDVINYDKGHDFSAKDALEKSVETQSDKSILDFDIDLPGSTIDSDHDSHQSAQTSSFTFASIPPENHLEEVSKPETISAVEVVLTETSDKGSAGGLPDVGIQRVESKELCLKDEGEEACVHVDRENDERDGLQPDDCFKGFPILPPEGPGSFKSIKSKGMDELSGSGSLSKLSGLGRAARRQLASILDEFWGHLFDFHGKLTQEATIARLDALLGLDQRTTGSTVKAESMGTGAPRSFFSNADMGDVFSTNSRNYNSAKQMKNHSVELPFGVQMGSSSWSQNLQSLNARLDSSSSSLLDPSERSYSSLNLPQFYDSRDHQPATIHGYQIASYLRETGATRFPYSSSISQNLPPAPKSVSSIATLRDQVMYAYGANELNSVGENFQNPALARISRLQAERPNYENLSSEAGETAVPSAHTKKYHSSPDISALIALGRTAYLNEAKRGAPIGPPHPSGRMASEQSQYVNPVSTGVPLAFDQLSPPKLHIDAFSLHQTLNSGAKSLWSRQPYDQLFGMGGKNQSGRDGEVLARPSDRREQTFPYAESGAKLLQSLRFCIMKLLKLEGSEWLFGQNGGFDEELIDRVAAAEKYLHREGNVEINQASSGELQHLSSDRMFNSSHGNEEADTYFSRPIPNCGDGCIWQAALVVSFGVWCIRRILELSIIESRPELWGKYTYVLNRLQGIIEPAFSRPRKPLSSCSCLERSTEGIVSFNTSLQNGSLRRTETPNSKSLTTASTILEIIRDVEVSVSGRKGRTGTAAGDVAFPKGKENLASVLKRYKRRLLNKS